MAPNNLVCSEKDGVSLMINSRSIEDYKTSHSRWGLKPKTKTMTQHESTVMVFPPNGLGQKLTMETKNIFTPKASDKTFRLSKSPFESLPIV